MGGTIIHWFDVNASLRFAQLALSRLKCWITANVAEVMLTCHADFTLRSYVLQTSSFTNRTNFKAKDPFTEGVRGPGVFESSRSL